MSGSTSSPASLLLRCFGPPAVLVDGHEPAPDVLWRKNLALLAYLALSPGMARSREHLLGLLWPEKPQDKARHSLNEALRRLRASLGVERVLSEGETVRLSGAGLVVDALEVRDPARRGRMAAADLLCGEFLEGLVLDDAPAFEEWVSGERRRFRALGVALLLDLGENALAENDFAKARAAARRARDLEPFSEPAIRILLKALVLSGDATGALAAFTEFQRGLREAIGEEPSPELLGLAERIRTKRWSTVSPAYTELEPPLIGRAQAHGTAFSLLEVGIRSGMRCLLVTGDPGMGRTRFLNACAERLALSGASVVTARPLENDLDTPWSTLRILASAGLAKLPGVAATMPRQLSVLAALAPELAEMVTPTPPRDTSEVATALEGILRAVAEEQPIGVLIDDSHLADGSSLGALAAAASKLGTARVVFVLTVDTTAEHVPRELVNLQGSIGRNIPGETVFLEPFSEEEMRQLVRALATWCDSEETVARLARRLVLEAGGIPLYAVTLLRDLDRTSTLKDDLLMWPRPAATMESPLPFSVPDLARLAVVGRVANLDDESGEVLRAASIGAGRGLDIQLISALVGISEERVEQVLDRLERLHFVRYEGDRYAFAAQMVASVIRGECLTPGRRQKLRRQALEVLEHRDDLESRVLYVEILTKVEPTERGFREALALAEAAIEAGSARAARRALAAAESIAPDSRAIEQVEAIRARLQV